MARLFRAVHRTGTSDPRRAGRAARAEMFLKWTTVVLLLLLLATSAIRLMAGWPEGAWNVVYTSIGLAFIVALFGYFVVDGVGEFAGKLRPDRFLRMSRIDRVGWIGRVLLFVALLSQSVIAAWESPAPAFVWVVRDAAAIGSVLCLVVWLVLRYRSRAIG